MFEIFNYKFKKTNLYFIYDTNNYILNLLNFDSNLRNLYSNYANVKF